MIQFKYIEPIKSQIRGWIPIAQQSMLQQESWVQRELEDRDFNLTAHPYIHKLRTYRILHSIKYGSDVNISPESKERFIQRYNKYFDINGSQITLTPTGDMKFNELCQETYDAVNNVIQATENISDEEIYKVVRLVDETSKTMSDSNVIYDEDIALIYANYPYHIDDILKNVSINSKFPAIAAYLKLNKMEKESKATVGQKPIEIDRIETFLNRVLQNEWNKIKEIAESLVWMNNALDYSIRFNVHIDDVTTREAGLDLLYDDISFAALYNDSVTELNDIQQRVEMLEFIRENGEVTVGEVIDRGFSVTSPYKYIVGMYSLIDMQQTGLIHILVDQQQSEIVRELLMNKNNTEIIKEDDIQNLNKLIQEIKVTE